MRSERTAGARAGGRGAITDKSREAAEYVSNTVTERVDQVKNQADSAKDHTAERIRRVAMQLRSMGETLRTDDTLAAGLADRASRSIESVADYVSSTDPRTVIRDTEQLARQRPALFFGGAFLLGLAAGRFLKSSRPEGYAGERRAAERYASDDGDSTRSEGWSSPDPDGVDRTGRRAPSQERFRQNYDAAFGRDLYERSGTSGASAETGIGSPAPGASVTPGTSATSGSVRPSSSGANPEPEKNGLSDPTKGSAS